MYSRAKAPRVAQDPARLGRTGEVTHDFASRFNAERVPEAEASAPLGRFLRLGIGAANLRTRMLRTRMAASTRSTRAQKAMHELALSLPMSKRSRDIDQSDRIARTTSRSRQVTRAKATVLTALIPGAPSKRSSAKEWPRYRAPRCRLTALNASSAGQVFAFAHCVVRYPSISDDALRRALSRCRSRRCAPYPVACARPASGTLPGCAFRPPDHHACIDALRLPARLAAYSARSACSSRPLAPAASSAGNVAMPTLAVTGGRSSP